MLVASIRPIMLRHDALTTEEKAEAAATFYVLGNSKVRMLWRQVAIGFSRPRGCLRALGNALKYGRGELRRTLHALFYLVEAVTAGEFFVRNGIRNVHCHYTSTVAWMLSPIFPEIELSMSIHGSGEFVDPYFRLPEKARACKRLIRVISQRGYDQLSASVAPRDRGKIRMFRLGIRPENFSPIEFRPDPDFFRILFVGGTDRPRSVDVILRALRELRGEFNFHFHIIGEGANCAELKKLAGKLGLEDRTIFHGWKNQDAIREFAADIFILSSQDEGIPVALMEAMGRRMCCIASDVGGVSELIRPGETGVLVKTGDVAGMAAAIRNVMVDRDLRRRLGENARVWILKEYDLDRNTAGFASLLCQPL